MAGDLKLRGSFVAIVTPFTADGRSVDEGQLRDLVEWHIAEGTHGIVPCGTTGESPTLSHKEHNRVVEVTVEAARKRVPVIAGAGSNSTAEAIELTRHAQGAGADYVLSITPYYNKPTQDGLVRHFTEIAEATNIPLVIYNVPGRTSVNMLPATVARAARHPRIVGIKEATADLRAAAEIVEACDSDFSLLSGDDFTVLPLLSVGGRGVISVTANVVPRLNAELVTSWERGDAARAREIQLELLSLAAALFHETNPIPVKAAVSLLNRCRNVVRAPLYPAGEKTMDLLRAAMKGLTTAA